MSSLRVIKAEALGHFSVDAKNKRHAIYSIDFQPGGPRLATGGHDSAVKLWNVEAFLNPGQGGAGTGDSLLATLSNHTKSVNIVRWSKDGKFLASGSDDCCILIYRHTPDGLVSAAFGSQTGSSKNKESWSRCAMLQGHTMDVLDLDWSPRGVLASASIDNRVLVWDCKTVGQGTQTIHTPMAALTVHQNYVKGCCFDPMGKYLVTCGSDNVIIVWDCDSWQPVFPTRASLNS
jgi:protein HIRA/HIR1